MPQFEAYFIVAVPDVAMRGVPISIERAFPGCGSQNKWRTSKLDEKPNRFMENESDIFKSIGCHVFRTARPPPKCSDKVACQARQWSKNPQARICRRKSLEKSLGITREWMVGSHKDESFVAKGFQGV